MAFMSLLVAYAAIAAIVTTFALILMLVGMVFFGVYLYHRYHGKYKKWAIVTANIFLPLGCIVLALPTASVVFLPLAVVSPAVCIFVYIIACFFALSVLFAGIVWLTIVRNRAHRGDKVGNVAFTAAFVIFYLGLAMVFICAAPPVLFFIGGS